VVYIPFDDDQWSRIESIFREYNQYDDRVRLPIREVAEWFASWISERLD
jgi:hypothetical protein